MSGPSFGAWLNSQIERREWTQADLARRLKRSTGSVSMWIAGTRIPDPQSCDLIADVLNLDIDTVLIAAGHRPRVDAIPADDPRRTIHALVNRIDWPKETGITRLIIGMLEDIRNEQDATPDVPPSGPQSEKRTR